jgi:mannose-1-phosphate guanylyltransferase
MNVILLSGGSGKRLWPLSNDVRSKQFLKLLKDESGQYQSMLQRVYSQVKQCGMADNIVIATSEAQKESTRSQLGDQVDIMVEPVRRDTFPAIALSCAELLWNKRNLPDSIVTILPVDMYVELDFFKTIQQAVDAVENNLSELVLVGVKPTFPTEKYGYIIPGGWLSDNVLSVSQFREKPTADLAKELIEQDALWNCGVFVCKLSYITDIIENQFNIHSFADLLEMYKNLPKISFDYAVVQKARSVAVVVYNNIWKDLGTWNTLAEEMTENTIGKVISAEETQNTQIINELGIPVIALGAKNMVIVANPDGILVADKEKSSFLKLYVDELELPPMYEEYAWGEYKVLGFNSHDDGSFSLVKQLFIRMGQSPSYHRHMLRDEILIFVEGTGTLLIDGHIKSISRGSKEYIKAGQMHSVRATTNLSIVEVQIGLELVEEDVIQEPYEW